MSHPGATPVSNDNTASVTELRKEVLRALEQRFTGLVNLCFPSGEELSMMVSKGCIRQAYYKDGPISKVAPNFWLAQQLSEKQALLSIQPLPERRLVFEKIILESSETGAEKKQGFKTSALGGFFSSLRAIESGSLIQIEWENAEGFVLVPGSKIDSHPAFFLGGGIIEEDSRAISAIEKWGEAECTLSVYRGGVGNEAWLETYLNVLFEATCNFLLTQYGYLTGRVMVNSVVQNMMILASQNDWEVNRSGNLVVDHTIFASPKDAATAYRELLATVLTHISVVIGPALVHSILQQGKYSYNNFYQSLIKTYELI